MNSFDGGHVLVTQNKQLIYLDRSLQPIWKEQMSCPAGLRSRCTRRPLNGVLVPIFLNSLTPDAGGPLPHTIYSSLLRGKLSVLAFIIPLFAAAYRPQRMRRPEFSNLAGEAKA